MPRTERDSAITNVALKFESSLTMKRRGKKMDALGIEPNTSRKPCYMLSERDNQLHHVPYIISIYGIINLSEYYLLRDFHVKHPREIFFKQYVSKAKAPASKFEI